MSLSSGLTLADLSDYLAPSQICIKPVNVEPATAEPEQVAATQIAIQSDGTYEVSSSRLARTDKGKQREEKPQKLKKAEITLNDCLACSGCITSAESVLVSLQSHEEVYRVLKDEPDRVPIMSIAPQSLASLAALHRMSVPRTLRALRTFFKRHFGFRLVFDTTFARSIALSEGWICYAEKTHGELLPFISKVKSPMAVMGSLVKNHPGSLARRLGIGDDDRVYHVSVMPCYDKKLEASRPDFATGDLRDTDCVVTTGEVQKMLEDANVELATIDLDYGDEERRFFPELVPAAGTSSGGYLHNAIEAFLETKTPDELYACRITESTLRSDYVEYAVSVGDRVEFRAARCYGFRNLQNLVRKVARDANLPVTRTTAAGKIMSRPARSRPTTATTKERPFDFVEVMACPSGCVNGGGQIPPASQRVDTALQDEEGMPLPPSTASTDETKMVVDVDNERRVLSGKDWVAHVETHYWQDVAIPTATTTVVDLERVDPSVRPYVSRARDDRVEQVVQEMTGGDAQLQEALLRTEYRKVESEEVNGLAVKW